jgi:hypothetical protein
MRILYKHSIFDIDGKHICSGYPCASRDWTVDYTMSVFVQDRQTYVTKTFLCLNHANDIRIKNEEEQNE